MKPTASQALRFFSSYGFSCILFLLLLVLTFLGTLYQVDNGVYQAQQKYFSSFFLVHHAFGAVPIPLPGAYLLMALLFVNLLLGGIVRARKGWSKMGILVAHAGVLVLLAGSFITAEFGINGYLKLYEGEESDTFASYTQWELAVSEAGRDGAVTEYVLYEPRLREATGPEGADFQFGDLPLVHLWSYMPNAMPRQKDAAPANIPVIDGVALEKIPNGDRERSIPGVYARLNGESIDGGTGIVWGAADRPLVLESGGRQLRIELRRRRWQLPFAIALTDFTRELYPGTQMPKVFRSDVVKVTDGARQDAVITMNVPLREQGYTLYQSSWGPENAAPGEPLYSVFAVVRNPADQFPLYACIVITAGLAFHFLLKLLHYLRQQSRLATQAAALLLAAGLLFANTAHAQPAPGPREFEPNTLRLLATLPVQDEGRVKPLDTYAGIRLLRFNGKRSTKNFAGKRIGPTEWIADCLFRPQIARHYKTFLLQDSDVAVAVGVEAQRKRDRYSYAQLAPARRKLIELARAYSEIPRDKQTAVQAQLINLAQNVVEFELICNTLEFARNKLAAPENPEANIVLGGQAEVPLSEVLAKAPALLDLVMKNDGEPVEGADAVVAFVRRARGRIASVNSLRLFPPTDAEKKEWMTVEDVADAALAAPGANFASTLNLFSALEKAAAHVSDAGTFAEAIKDFHKGTVGLAKTRGEYGKIPLEVTFHRLKPFYYSLILFVFSFMVMMVSWMAPRRKPLYILGLLTAIAPALLLAAGITMRCVIRNRPPVTTLYETILFATLVAVVVALFIEFANRHRTTLTLASALGAMGMFIAIKYELREGADTMPSMIAVLDTNFWLATHVTTITMGYGAGFLASALGHVFILAKILGIKRGDREFYKHLSRMIYGVLCFSLLFAIVGTVLGGIWANESWGRFWGWDPKENGALMIVLWQLAIVHARLGGYIRERGVAMAAVFTGVIVAFSWFGVNLLGVGLHSYGFTSGTFNVLLAFYAIEGIVLLAGAATWAKDRPAITSAEPVSSKRTPYGRSKASIPPQQTPPP